jgi:two-component sensor histidine kinase
LDFTQTSAPGPMTSIPDEPGELFDRASLRRVLMQRAALVELGAEALRRSDFQGFVDEAVRLAAEGAETPMAKLVQRLDDGKLLLVSAWNLKPGFVGRIVGTDDAGCPPGEALSNLRVVIVDDVRAVKSYHLPPIFPEHGVVASANVPVVGRRGVFGVLEVDCTERRQFDRLDVSFLEGVASMIAEGVDRLRQHRALLLDLDSKVTMLREQQHRVRNDFMTIVSSIQRSERLAGSVEERARWAATERRVFALSALYDHLLGTDQAKSVSVVAYLSTLCDRVRDFHELRARAIEIHCEGDETLEAERDWCSAIGTIVNELVANSLEHAFEGRRGGKIRVCVGGNATRMLTVLVEDDGRGFAANSTESLGLTTARRFAAQLGGTLVLPSPGGKQWRIELPLSDIELPLSGSGTR